MMCSDEADVAARKGIKPAQWPNKYIGYRSEYPNRQWYDYHIKQLQTPNNNANRKLTSNCISASFFILDFFLNPFL